MIKAITMVTVCKMSRPATGPGSLHHNRGQIDVTVYLQDGNLLEVSETVLVVVCLHPIDHNPEGVMLTTDGQLKDKKGIFKLYMKKENYLCTMTF